jgi:hypothetical protein
MGEGVGLTAEGMGRGCNTQPTSSKSVRRLRYREADPQNPKGVGRQAGKYSVELKGGSKGGCLRGGSVNYRKWDVETAVITRAVRGQQQHFRTDFGARKAPWDTGRTERSRRWTKRREEGR